MFIINKNKIVDVLYKYRDAMIDGILLFPTVQMLTKENNPRGKQDIDFCLGLDYLINQEQHYLEKYEFGYFIKNNIFDILIKQSLLAIFYNFTIKPNPGSFHNQKLLNKLKEIIENNFSTLSTN